MYDLVGQGELGFEGDALQGWNRYTERYFTRTLILTVTMTLALNPDPNPNPNPKI